MKTPLFEQIYREIGEGLGLLDPHQLAAAPVDAAKVREALGTLEKIQLAWRQRGITRTDIRAMINEGRP